MLKQYQLDLINAKYDVAMTNPVSDKNPNEQYVFVFWNNQFPDQHIVDFVMQLRNADIEVQIINVAESAILGLGSGAKRYPLHPNITLEEAIALAQHAVCIALPHNSNLLGLTLAQPNIEIFMQQAAKNNAILIGHTEVVAQFALYKTAEKSVDLVYPNTHKKLGQLMNQAVIVLKKLLR